MAITTVKELIEMLQLIGDKDLPVTLETSKCSDNTDRIGAIEEFSNKVILRRS